MACGKNYVQYYTQKWPGGNPANTPSPSQRFYGSRARGVLAWRVEKTTCSTTRKNGLAETLLTHLRLRNASTDRARAEFWHGVWKKLRAVLHAKMAWRKPC